MAAEETNIFSKIHKGFISNFCTVPVEGFKMSRGTFEECGLSDVMNRNNCHRSPYRIQFLNSLQKHEFSIRHFGELYQCLAALLWM